MHLGLRARPAFPKEYHGFHLLRTHGRVYAVPFDLDPEELDKLNLLFTHPGVLRAGTLEEVQSLIDAYHATGQAPEVIDTYAGYDIVRYRDELHGVRQSAGIVDLDLPEDRRRGGVVTGRTLDEVRERIDEQQVGDPVEFAGWLPIYAFSGDCGRHPQFTHTADPPAGYRFVCTAPPKRKPSWWSTTTARLGKKAVEWGRRLGNSFLQTVRPPFSMLFGGPRVGVRARLRTIRAVGKLAWAMLKNGCKLWAVMRFLQSRHFHSQLMLANNPDGLLFLTSMPYTYGQNPWIVEIEDPTTLFYPLIVNGITADVDVVNSPYLPVVRTLLEQDSCKAIVTHMRSTADMLPTLFKSDVVRDKVMYAPLGVKMPARWQRHDDEPGDEIHLLFINSWCQIPANFYVRGGLDLLEAYAVLRQRYPQLRLTIRSSLPMLDDSYTRILEQPDVRVIGRFLSTREMADLHAQSHIYLLPAARVHIVSLLQAMSYGLAVVASDGWGFNEYIDPDRNGLVVTGRYGKIAWVDEQAGMLRENYEPMWGPDPAVVAQLVDAISRLVEDRELRRRLGRAARHDVETKYNLAQWNRGLQAAFDRAHGVRPSGVSTTADGRPLERPVTRGSC